MKKLCNQIETQMLTYKCMASTYWERWRFELDERKALQEREKEYLFQIKHKLPSTSGLPQTIPSIDRSLLYNLPSTMNSKDIYVARGSFGIIKHQSYRGIEVAVKEFLPRSNVHSVAT